MQLRIMSFNLRFADAPDGDNRWEMRHELLRRTIRRFDPDILATQECLLRQRIYLCTHLPGYDCVGVGRDDGREVGEMAAIFFKRDNFALQTAGHFWLSDSPDLPGSRSWDSSAARMCTWVRLAPHPDPEKCITVFNTHLDVHGATARERGAAIIRKRIENTCRTRGAILAGDFNARPGTVVHNTLLQDPTGHRTPMHDTFQLLHPDASDTTCGTTHGFTGERDRGRIDWVLVSPDITPIEAGIDHSHDNGRYPSDHFPVTALLEL